MSVINESAQETMTARLYELVDLLDKNGNVYTFKVKRDLPDIEEKLLLAGQSTDLKYITIIIGSYNTYEKIKWTYASGKSYSAERGELLSDAFSEKCRYTSKIVNLLSLN